MWKKKFFFFDSRDRKCFSRKKLSRALARTCLSITRVRSIISVKNREKRNRICWSAKRSKRQNVEFSTNLSSLRKQCYLTLSTFHKSSTWYFESSNNREFSFSAGFYDVHKKFLFERLAKLFKSPRLMVLLMEKNYSSFLWHAIYISVVARRGRTRCKHNIESFIDLKFFFRRTLLLSNLLFSSILIWLKSC